MAEIKELTISMSLLEARAAMFALGRMSGKEYSDMDLCEPGSELYSLLAAVLDDE